jgi:hypothetical protein
MGESGECNNGSFPERISPPWGNPDCWVSIITDVGGGGRYDDGGGPPPPLDDDDERVLRSQLCSLS